MLALTVHPRMIKQHSGALPRGAHESLVPPHGREGADPEEPGKHDGTLPPMLL